ncbi:insulin-like [Leptodactylus fuscus]
MGQGQWRKIAICLLLMFCLTEIQGASVRHLCGVHLVESLMLVCEGKGLYYKNHKGPAPIATHRLSQRNKKKIGIVEKCCYQSCTFYDLQTYCKT